MNWQSKINQTICECFIYALQQQFRLYIPFLGIARPQSQFPHSCVFERFIFRISLHISSSRTGRHIEGIYNSLTDTCLWKLGMRPRYSFSGNICFKFSAFCLCSVGDWMVNWKTGWWKDKTNLTNRFWVYILWQCVSTRTIKICSMHYQSAWHLTGHWAQSCRDSTCGRYRQSSGHPWPWSIISKRQKLWQDQSHDHGLSETEYLWHTPLVLLISARISSVVSQRQYLRKIPSVLRPLRRHRAWSRRDITCADPVSPPDLCLAAERGLAET